MAGMSDILRGAAGRVLDPGGAGNALLTGLGLAGGTAAQAIRQGGEQGMPGGPLAALFSGSALPNVSQRPDGGARFTFDTPGGTPLTLGAAQYLDPGSTPRTRQHEDTHSLQMERLGPLLALLAGPEALEEHAYGAEPALPAGASQAERDDARMTQFSLEDLQRQRGARESVALPLLQALTGRGPAPTR